MFDVIIVGGGVAAFSAALFTSRRGLKTLVIGKDVAGQANFSDTIENFPGLEEIGGYDLVSTIRRQAEKYGAEYLQAEVSKLKFASDAFVVTAYDKQYKAQSIILAYGKTPRDLNVPGEQELKGKGVSYCATCDASLFKKKIVVVAGIGDVAADAGLLLSKFAKKVYILSKTDKFVAHPALSKALFKKNNVELVPFIQIQQLLGEIRLTGAQLLDLKTGKQKNLAMDGLFVELGYVVDSNFVKNIVKLDDQEQIAVNSDQSTSFPGIFAAGDATSNLYKQAVISAGEGAAAALACYDWLMRQKGGVGLTSDWTKIKKVK
ncbi:MAG TPA: FAD-dependent oxidoreductase [Patescibacteria group bacterium]